MSKVDIEIRNLILIGEGVERSGGKFIDKEPTRNTATRQLKSSLRQMIEGLKKHSFNDGSNYTTEYIKKSDVLSLFK